MKMVKNDEIKENGKDNRQTLRFRKYAQLVAKLAEIQGKRLDLSELDMPVGIKFDTKLQKITYGGNGFGVPFSFEVYSEKDKAMKKVAGHIKGHPTKKTNQEHSDLCNFHVKVEMVNGVVCDASRYFGPSIPKKKTVDEEYYDALAESQPEIDAAVQQLGYTIIDLVYNNCPQHDVDIERGCDPRVKVIAPKPPAMPPAGYAGNPAAIAAKNGFFAANGAAAPSSDYQASKKYQGVTQVWRPAAAVVANTPANSNAPNSNMN